MGDQQDPQRRSPSPQGKPENAGENEEENDEEVELDLDDLTQEDKFFLIQQIEAVQKNIRYYSDNQETYVFQDFDDGEAKEDRYGGAGDDEELVDESGKDQTYQAG